MNVPEGACHLFVGPNGIGKTTLLRAICGLLPVSEGRIIFDDQELRHCTHYLAHDDALKDALTVREQVGYWGHLLGSPLAGELSCEAESEAGLRGVKTQTAEQYPPQPRYTRQLPRKGGAECVQKIALSDFLNTPTKHLSAGQRKRLSLARLLIAPRPIWCLDEPTNTLDAQGIELLNALIHTHTQNGGIALVSTHSPQLIPQGTAISLEKFAKNLNSGHFFDTNNLS